MTSREKVLKQIKNINSLLKEKTEFSLTEEGEKYFLRLLKKYSYKDIKKALIISINEYFVIGDDDTRKEIIANLEGILYNLEFQKEKPELPEINYLLKIAKNRFGLNGLYYKNIKELLLENYKKRDFQNIKNIFCNYSGYTPLMNQLEIYYGKE